MAPNTTDDHDHGPAVANDRGLLAAIVDSTDDAVVSIDRERRITSWNRAAERLYGYAPSQMLGRPVDVLYPATDDPAELVERIFAGQQVAGAERLRVRADGTTVMVDETLSPVRDDDGSVVGAAMIVRDISRRRQTEDALAETRQELEANLRQLERSNNDLEQFAYVASHDLSEPLRAVAGMVGLLARRYRGQLDSDADEFIDFAVEGCERMRRMIEDLLAYSRAGRGELRITSLDVGGLVAEVVGTLASQIDLADATIDIDDLPVIHADRGQLASVFQNLVSNAVKFRRPDSPVHVRVSASPVPIGWRFAVADDGIGIEEEYRTRIFRMFQRLHPSDRYPGTGIGLAIAERIVDRHGGTMGVEGNAIGGSTFWFTIPDLQEDARS